uniref:Thymidine kinase n=1 Tax=Globodera pallida TaxID=36090 RepID=A0A183BXS0_GLOPA
MSECQCHQRGSIHLIIGPMFSGKTTELFRLAQRYILAGRKVAVVKYALDTRYDETHACTHDLRKMEAMRATEMAEAFDELRKFDVIGIDEGQFFKDIVKYAQELANIGKTVIIAALNGDYRQEVRTESC